MPGPATARDWADDKAADLVWREYGGMIEKLSWVFRDYQKHIDECQKRIDELESQVAMLKAERDGRGRSPE